MMRLWFGPLSQRVIALGLAFLVILLTVQWVIAPIFSAISDGRAELATLRERRATLISAKTWPSVTAPPAQSAGWVMRGRAAALRRQLSTQIEALAQANGITLSVVNVTMPDTAGTQTVTITLAARGPHDAMLRWIAAIERAAPVMRGKTARLQPIAGRDGELSLDAVYITMAVVS